jgi:hypothetical protein
VRSRFWILISLLLPTVAGAQAIRLGSEFRVGNLFSGEKYEPAAAADADGDFVVVWLGEGGADGRTTIRFSGFSSAGVPLFGEFAVPQSHTLSSRAQPAVAAEADGGFVVAWTSYNQESYASGIFAQRFSSQGAPLAIEFQVNTYTLDYQLLPSVAIDGKGDFVIAWESYQQDDWGWGVFAQRFSSEGVPLASEFQVNSYTINIQAYPSVAAEPDGDFIIAWHSFGFLDFTCDLFARRFSSTGTPLASEFQINSYTNGQCVPRIAVEPDGDFVISATRFAEHGYDGVFAHRFSSAGSRLGDEFQVNSFTDGQGFSSLGVSNRGDFSIAWESFEQDGSLGGIFGQVFSSDGEPLGTEFPINSFTVNDQRRPVLAMADRGDFVVVWQSRGQYGRPWRVFGQRFAIPTTTETPTLTPTATSTVTPTSTSTNTAIAPGALYSIPTLSRAALAIMVIVLLTVSFVFLLTRR